MKFFGKIVLIVLAASAAPLGVAWAQYPICWTSITPPNDTLHLFVNPDSVMIDTCSGSSTFHHRYAAKWFRIEFQKVIFYIPSSSNIDTIIDRGWRDIDTNQIIMRAAFDSVEVHFGSFVLQKAFPGAGDTTTLFNLLQSQIFLLKFNNYVDIDSAQAMLKTIPSVNAYYQNRAVGASWVPSDLGMVPQTDISEIQLANPDSFFKKFYHKIVGVGVYIK